MTRFADRREAGRLLAPLVADRRLDAPVVVGLPRGGVPVAAAVARALPAPLDVLVVRKLGVPGHEELGFGAIGEDGAIVVDTALVHRIGITDAEIGAVEARERAELQRRVDEYRDGRDAVPLAGHDVVVVDDGVATGGTARAAALVARHRGARRVVLAVPVGAPTSLEQLRDVYDDVIAVIAPPNLFAVGEWYDDFTATNDAEVVQALRGG